MSEDNGLVDALQFARDENSAKQLPKQALGGKQFVMVPEGYHVYEFKPANEELGRIKQQVKLFDSASFVAYFNRFMVNESQIFADPNGSNGPTIKAVLDYHKPVVANQAGTPLTENNYEPNFGKATYGSHQAIFTVPYSEQWARWRSIDGKRLSQKEFAEFIEENYMDVTKPTHGDMLSMVSTMEAKKDVKFASAVNLQQGDVQFTYAEETKQTKGTMNVPKSFELTLPVFNNGKAFKVSCLLRYSLNEGSLAFTVKLARRTFLEQEAFKTIIDEVAKETKVVPYLASL